jgi:hypothetical protein
LDQLEHFTCLLYDKRSSTTDINILRYEKFLIRNKPKQGTLMTDYNGVDMSLLPPCKAALQIHVKRANYQALIWYQADQAIQRVPKPDRNGWETKNGKLTIKWTDQVD